MINKDHKYIMYVKVELTWVRATSTSSSSERFTRCKCIETEDCLCPLGSRSESLLWVLLFQHKKDGSCSATKYHTHWGRRNSSSSEPSNTTTAKCAASVPSFPWAPPCALCVSKVVTGFSTRWNRDLFILPSYLWPTKHTQPVS